MLFNKEHKHFEKFDTNELTGLNNRVFFYPCSAEDIEIPVLLLTPWIDTFWFVDTCYFSRKNPSDCPPALENHKLFDLYDKEIHIADLPKEDWEKDTRYQGIPPFILKEHYVHLPTRKMITVIRHRRRGPSALRNEITNLGVFFYRGDSPEGSGTMWLTAWKKPLNKGTALPLLITEKLVDGGYIITDGSMCEQVGNPYSFFRSAAVEINQTGTLEKTSILDPFGNTFKYTGVVDYRNNRATISWKIHKI